MKQIMLHDVILNECVYVCVSYGVFILPIYFFFSNSTNYFYFIAYVFRVISYLLLKIAFKSVTVCSSNC